MMLAVKHLDPVVGVDIHFIITPAGVVVPIPHPHVGLVFDPFDYLPVIGATVLVNGLPRAQAGTGGRTLPPHFPIGGVFAKPAYRQDRGRVEAGLIQSPTGKVIPPGPTAEV